MKQIQLGNTGITVSQLGFGCVALTMHESHDKAVALMNHALDLGITHFDVARLYGSGEAETILGKFLQGKRDRVTVTTKFGMFPPRTLAGSPGLKNVARKLARRFSFVRRLAGGIAAKSGAKEHAFTPDDAAISLDESLRQLQTNYVDILTLHEGTPADARRDDLIAYLDKQVQAGRIRAWGVSSQIGKLGMDAGVYPDQCRFLQFDHDAQNRNLEKMTNIGSRGIGIFAVLHPLKMLVQAAADHPERAKNHGQMIGIDLTNVASLASLLLNDAVVVNTAGVTLISTTRSQHLAGNVAEVQRNPYSAEQLRRFSDYIRAVKAANSE